MGSVTSHLDGTWSSSDGRNFDSRSDAESHQRYIDEEEKREKERYESYQHTEPESTFTVNAPPRAAADPAPTAASRWFKQSHAALKCLSAGEFDQTIQMCDKALGELTGRDPNNGTAAIGLAFTLRGMAYCQNGEETRERGIEDLKEGADWGNETAKQTLGYMSIAYTPGTPKTRNRYFPGSNSPQAGTSAKDGKWIAGFVRSLIPGIVFGIGVFFAAKWFHSQFNVQGIPLRDSVILTAGASLVSAFLIKIKAWKLVFFLALLAAAGFLCQFGVVPADLWRGEAVTAAYENAAAENSAVVTSDALNLRVEASGGAAVVKTLKKGDTLTVTGEDADGWTPVEHEGDTGWVSSEFLESN